MERLRYLQLYYPVLILMFWFGTLTLFFPVLPEVFNWLYILLFPILIGRELLRRSNEGSLKFRPNIFEIAIGAYIIYVFVSLLTNDSFLLPHSIYIVEFLFRIVSPICLYIFVRLHPLDQPQLKLMVYAVASLVLIQTAVGFVSLMFPTALPSAYQPRPAHIYTRATGTFTSPEGYVITLQFGLVMLFYGISQKARLRERRWLQLVLGIGIFGIILGQNRTGWITATLLLMVFSYLDRNLIKWFVGGGVILALATLILYPDFINRTLTRLTQIREVESRVIMDVAGLRMFLEKPITGWGYATYDLFDWQFMEKVWELEPTRYELAIATSHNGYLTILAETGIIGFFLYMALTLYWFVRTILARYTSVYRDNRTTLVLMWAMVMVVHLSMQTADMRFFPFVLGYWWFTLAMVANILSNGSPQDEIRSL